MALARPGDRSIGYRSLARAHTAVAFRSTFDCLWCGRAWHAAAESDLTGWASLCPDCLEHAQDNGFLRSRLRAALRERAGGAGGVTAPSAPETTPESRDGLDAEMQAYYAARAPDYDDWYLRRGAYTRGPARDLAWHMELDTATAWLDAQPFAGRIVELAAGTGWWSPLLALAREQR